MRPDNELIKYEPKNAATFAPLFYDGEASESR